MPLFEVTDDVFQGFDEETFRSSLPAASTFSQAGLDPRAKSLVDNLARPQWENFSLASRMAMQFESERFGIPSWRVGPMADVFKAARLVATTELRSAAAPVLAGFRAAISGQLLRFDEALQIIGTRVPVIGPFVGLAVQLGRAIRDAIVGAREKPAAVPALVYDDGADTDFSRQLIEAMREPDWTRIFMPVRPGSDGFEVQPVQAGGVRGNVFRSRLFGDGGAGLGVLPDLANVDPYKGAQYGETPPNTVGSVGTWQYIKSTGRDPGPESLRGYAAFFPSATQVGMFAWQRVMQVGAAMFRVDGEAIESAWLDYFDRLAAWAQGQDDAVLRRLALYAASWGDPSTFGAQVPASMRRADGRNKFHRTWSVEEYTPAVRKWPGSLGELVSFSMRRRYFKQLRPALRTLVCAYVPTDAPALVADPSLRSYHDEMRRRLLHHPARFKVDIDMIPDHDGSDYRKAMWQATVAVGGIKANVPEAPAVVQLASFDGAPLFEPEGEPPPGYGGPTGQGAPPDFVQWVREHPVATAAGVAGIGAAGVGAWWLWGR